MDKVTIGSGKLLIDKKGKLLVQGDDKVASSNPNESHQLITRTNPDGSSNLYMVPSEGVNKGKFFLVMPENNTGKQDIPSNDLSSNKVSKPLPENSTFPNSLEPKWEAPGSQCLSTVLKNIANHISSESKASEDVKLLKSNSIPSSNQVPTEVESPASVSSFVLTGASIIDHSSAICESQVNQEHDVKSSTNLSVIEPKPYVIQDTSSIPGNSLTVPSVGTIPIAPLPSVPSLPSSQPMMILTSAAVPAKPSRTCDEPLPTALNAPPLHQLPAGTSLSQPITTYIQTPYVVVSSTSSHPLSYPLSSTAMLPSNQPTLVTSSSIQQVQKTGVPNSSLQIPLIPVLINTNQTNTSVPSFLQTPCTNVSVVPKPATLIPNILKRTTTASSCTSHQLKSTVSAVPMTTSSEKTNITNGTHIQQAPEVALVSPPAKESPLFVTAQEAAALLGKSPVPNNKTLQDTLAFFLKNRKMIPQPTFPLSSKVLKSRQNTVTPISRKSTVPSTTSQSMNLTTTAPFTKSLPKVISVVTSDHLQAVPVPKTADDTPVLISNKNKGCPSDKTMACSTNTTTTFKTATSSGDFASAISAQVSRLSDETTSCSATPMVLFSHNAALNLKPTGLLDPLGPQGSKTAHNTTTPKILPKITIPQANIDKPLGSLSGLHQSLPSSLKLEDNMYQFFIHQNSTTKPKTITVFKVPVSNQQILETTSSGSSTISSSTVTSSSVSASGNVSFPVPTSKATVEASTTSSSKINSQNVPVHVIVTQTSSPTKTSCISSYSNAPISSKPTFTYVRSSGPTESSPYIVTPVIHETDSSERRKPKIIISTLSSKLKKENETMGNLVSIVPSKCARLTTSPVGSLRNISSNTGSRVVNVKTINDDKNVRNTFHPVSKLPSDSTQSNITAFPKLTEQLNASCKPLKDKSADDLPILIDSVFSLSSGDQTTQSATPNIDFFEADNLYRDSDASNTNRLNQHLSSTNSGQSSSQTFREFDHLSNFNGVILPDEAITESKLFSPSYVVLETLRMHGGKMEGVNTRCSRTCRQKFLSKKSNIRLAIHRKKPVSKRVESQKDSTADNPQGQKGDVCVTSDNKLSDASISSNAVNIKQSRDILRAKLDTAGHVTACTKGDTITKIDENQGKRVTSNNAVLRLKYETSDGIKTAACSAIPVKKVPNTEQFYMIRVDGKTVLVPYMNGGSQAKAFIINDNKINLASHVVSKSSPKDSTRPNEIALSHVTSKACTTAPTSANAVPIISTSAQLPTTTSAKVNIKPEPVTYGYGDEASIQPTVVVKQERMDRGYSDEPPKLERMDVDKSKRKSCELKLKREVPIPELTAEEVAVPAKVPRVLSKEERISSLKELLKKQEKDLEEIRQRRIAEATPVDLDF